MNKIYPNNIEFQVKAALEFYPELENVNIEFVFARIKTTMAARPSIISLFSKKRSYCIYINCKTSNHFGIVFNDVPFKAQVGLIAHELGHVFDYENKNIFQIIKTGLLYLTKKYRQQYEQEIDSVTVQHGAGWHLYEYTLFVMNSNLVSNKYKSFIKKYYLQASDIEQLIESQTRKDKINEY